MPKRTMQMGKRKGKVLKASHLPAKIEFISKRIKAATQSFDDIKSIKQERKYVLYDLFSKMIF